MATTGETEAAADYDKVFENNFRRGNAGNSDEDGRRVFNRE